MLLPRFRPLALVLFLAGCAPRSVMPARPATPSAKAAQPHPEAVHAKVEPSPRTSVNTGDPIPATPAPHNPACPDQRKGAARWIDSDPHTPFFVADDQGIHAAGACCTEWGRAGTRWSTLDPYGQIIGHAEIVAGAGYDVTQCYELSFRLLAGRPGVGLYVSDAWKPPRPARWIPPKAERTTYALFVSRTEHLLADDLPSGAPGKPLPLDKRTLYFQVDGGYYANDRRVEHYAVAGGRLLVIARLNAKGRWVASYLDMKLTNDLGVVRAYRPLAVLDVDGDGVPEVIFHSNGGGGWYDTLLHLGVNGWNWHAVAKSVGGSTA